MTTYISEFFLIDSHLYIKIKKREGEFQPLFFCVKTLHSPLVAAFFEVLIPVTAVSIDRCSVLIL